MSDKWEPDTLPIDVWVDELPQNKRIKELEAQLAELNSPVQLSEWQKMEQQLTATQAKLAELRKAAQFAYDRMVNVHGENANYDYMRKLAEALLQESSDD